MEKISVKQIKMMPYIKFVSLINQWNTLPGSYSTLSKWAQFSNLNRRSRLLDIACTTGFSSRELAVLTGCSGDGIDLSEIAVKMANYNKNKYAPEVRVKYMRADAYKFKPEIKYSHVVIGASLGFFSDPHRMLLRCINFLEDSGKILASPFYAIKKIPFHVLQEGERIFDLRITSTPYKEIMSMYNKFEIIFEERNSIFRESDSEIEHYCRSTIDTACEMLNVDDKDVYRAMYDRLRKIKEMTNILRNYQHYSILVLRYRRSLYPRRFAELF